LSNILKGAAVPLSDAQIALSELDEGDRSSGAFLSHLASTMSVHGTEAASADLALDLALNDIAEQARLETNAGAAVIALQCGEEMVCRAYAGKRALELGEFLQGAGLFDDWAHARKVQCCTDTEADVRVDVAACHRLGVRSFLILPVLKQEELVGLFGISSSSPEAFAHREIGILEALSRQVLIHVDCAAEFSILPSKEEPSMFADSTGPTSATFPIGQREVKSSEFQVGDPRTPLLVAVIAAALLVGWMLGRSSWSGTAHRKEPAARLGAKPEVTFPQTGEAKQAEPNPPPTIRQKARSSEAPPDLVVYQDGKVIYRLKSSRGQDESVAPGSRKADVQLLQRAEPDYPAAAKRQHIQGPVVLEANVGEHGEVQHLTVISGNPILAAAASDAVLQWRFNPHLQNGRSVPFQTRITVKFVLP
jgi:TonB family protein